MRTKPLALLLAALLSSAPALTFAQMTDEQAARARELFENGAMLYEEGLYEQAIVAWQEAYDLSNEPLLLFNIANALERSGRFEEALEHLNRYRAYATSEERSTLERRIHNLEVRVQEQRQAEAERQRQLEEERQRLAAEAEAARLAAEQAAVQQQPERADIGPLEWTFAGLTVAGLGMGIAFGVQANGHHNDAEDLCTGDGFCPAEAQDAIDKERSAALLADVGFGVAALSAIGFGVTYIVRHTGNDRDDSAGGAEVSVSPVFGAGSAGLQIRGAF